MVAEQSQHGVVGKPKSPGKLRMQLQSESEGKRLTDEQLIDAESKSSRAF